MNHIYKYYYWKIDLIGSALGEEKMSPIQKLSFEKKVLKVKKNLLFLQLMTTFHKFDLKGTLMQIWKSPCMLLFI